DSIAAWHKFAAGERKARTIDLGVIQPVAKSTSPVHPDNTEHYFCCVAGVGLDAQITKRANLLPRWFRARGGYGLAAPREFLRFAPFPMRVSPNGNSPGAFQPTTLAAVANAPSYGGGMKIAPSAKLDDGKLDLCIVRGMNKFSL